jgi:formylglycine-generating enzyme required for sulfatase activity
MRQERMFWARCLLAPVFGGESKADMVFVPGGLFRMGSDGHYPEEGPAHQVSIDGFWIDRTPVTNWQFKKFVRSERGNANHLASVAGGLFLQGQDKGGNIVDGRSAERQLRHARMRRQNEMGEAIAVEARRLSDRSKGRRAGL